MNFPQSSNRHISAKGRTTLVSALLVGVLVVFTITLHLGQQQDSVFLNDNNLFQTALSVQTQDPTQAEPLLRQLLVTHTDSYLLLWDLADVLAAEHKYAEAAQYYTLARHARPILVSDQQYLLSYATTLFNLGELKLAQQYLSHAGPNVFSSNDNPQLTKQVNTLQLQIDKTLASSIGGAKR